MAITYSWIIKTLDCAPSEDGLTDVVKTVHWNYKGIDTDGTTYTVVGFTDLSSPDPSNFTAYDDLTLAIVGGWLDSVVDVVPLQASISKNINNIQNPSVVPLPLPTPPSGSNP